MEIVVVDGGSVDGTAIEAERELGAGGISWRIVRNDVGTTPANLNAGLAVARGEIVCRVDARSIVPQDYVRLCAQTLGNCADVTVVGGAQVALPVGTSSLALGIARALNNRYTMGGSRYRAGTSSGPSDTVYLGAFRTADLRDVGGWDEYFRTNQDFDLNQRLARRGLVWFDDRLQVGYVPRTSLIDLWHQYHRFGRWKVRYWRRTGERPRRRQVTALLVAGSGAVAATSAFLCARSRSSRIAVVTAPVACLIALDQAGADGVNASEAPVSVGTRLFSTLAIGAVTTGWLSGISRELVSPEVDHC